VTANTKAEAGLCEGQLTSNAKVVERTSCAADGNKLAKVILSTYCAVTATNKVGAGTL
jgi:hypothetical protein